MKIFKTIINILLIIPAFLICSYAFQDEKKKPVDVIHLNREFYMNFLNTRVIERDILLGEMQDRIVQGRGYVDSVDKIDRYHRHIRITVIDNEAAGLNIRLFIFADNEEYISLLQKGDAFDFKGQFVVFTPLSSKRDAYIFDIILEEGALSVN